MPIDIREVVADTLLITGFVFMMMLLVEYLNILSAGLLQDRLKNGGMKSLSGAALLGATPGCLGAFTNVTLYIHGIISFGAVAGGMVATSGDEAFIMLALFPRRALLLFGILFFYGIFVGWVMDRVFQRPFYRGSLCASGISLHERKRFHAFPFFGAAGPLRPFLRRTAIFLGLALFLAAVVSGLLGPPEWNWIRWSLVILSSAALWIVFSVSDHFLEDHLYKHVVREHLLRIFLWVFIILLTTEWINGGGLPIADHVREHPVAALCLAALLGILPESGPHLVFVTLYAEGWLPFSVLVASSIVQDGHGMLPLLAESRKEFFKVKAVNLAAGMILGLTLMAMGL